MNTQLIEGSAVDALKHLNDQEVMCRTEIASAQAWIRLFNSKDGQLVLKDIDTQTVDFVKALAYSQSAEGASKALSGISRFHEMRVSSSIRIQTSESHLLTIEDQRSQITASIHEENEG